MDTFAGRVAVITGAASGIGLALAEALAALGCRLVLADIDAGRLEAIAGGFAEAIAVRTDVSDRASVEALADAAYDRFGAVDLLFNNAGVAVYGSALEIGLTEWRWSIDVNLWGVIHGIGAFLPRMVAQGTKGHIVNTSSFAGLVAPPSNIAYNVAKAAVVSLSESLRQDLAGTAIGVSVLCPMQVGTRIWQSSGDNRPSEDGRAFLRPSDAMLAAVAGGVQDAALVAERTIEGIRANRLYIFPNADSAVALDEKHRGYAQ